MPIVSERGFAFYLPLTCLATPRRTRHDEAIHQHDHQAHQSHKQRSLQPQHASLCLCVFVELDLVSRAKRADRRRKALTMMTRASVANDNNATCSAVAPCLLTAWMFFFSSYFRCLVCCFVAFQDLRANRMGCGVVAIMRKEEREGTGNTQEVGFSCGPNEMYSKKSTNTKTERIRMHNILSRIIYGGLATFDA